MIDELPTYESRVGEKVRLAIGDLYDGFARFRDGEALIVLAKPPLPKDFDGTIDGELARVRVSRLAKPADPRVQSQPFARVTILPPLA